MTVATPAISQPEAEPSLRRRRVKSGKSHADVPRRVRRSSSLPCMEIAENRVTGDQPSSRRSIGFTTRKIACQQSLGECLSQRRAALSLTLDDAAHKLTINAQYLEALEKSDHRALPGTVYAVAFLKAYAQLLGLDANEAIARYRSELKITRHAAAQATERWQPVRRVGWWQLLVPARLMRNAGIALVLAVCLTYLGFKVEAIVQPPFLNVSSPADELLTESPVLTVAGQTEVGSTVTVNGQEVFNDERGQFSVPLDLQPGVNLIRVTARKHRGSETVIQRSVVLEPKEP